MTHAQPSPAALAAMRRLARLYLENVPPSYLHMAIAMRNLQVFSSEELRAELVRRDISPAFPEPNQLLEELQELEERALEDAAASLGVDIDPPTPRSGALDDRAVLVDDPKSGETE